MPNDEKMQKRAGKLLEEFKDLVFPEGYTPGVKRKVGLSCLLTIRYNIVITNVVAVIINDVMLK